MSKIDFAKVKGDMCQIIDIVKTVPEALQQRCFELLFEAAFPDLHSVRANSPPKGMRVRAVQRKFRLYPTKSCRRM